MTNSIGNQNLSKNWFNRYFMKIFKSMVTDVTAVFDLKLPI